MSTRISCMHLPAQTASSDHAAEIGYKPYTQQQLFTAATGSRQRINSEQCVSLTHPAPLVLPGDDLANDPRYPPQSFQSWLKEEDRNDVTRQRKTVYVIAPPVIDENMSKAMQGWDAARQECLDHIDASKFSQVSRVVDYLQAFFHGLPVRQHAHPLKFSTWSASTAESLHAPPYVGLTDGLTGTVTRIRVRHRSVYTDPSAWPSAYDTQLNLNDIIDHLIATLPKDAYCVVLVLNHDLYEDDEDDFCCGRAYGGSRVSCVSTAQYHPALDTWHSVDTIKGHWWPGSHCASYMKELCGSVNTKSKKKSTAVSKKASALTDQPSSALEAAIRAHREAMMQVKELSTTAAESLYLRRVCLTASHELSHCFGLDHCVYYACAMQSTASIIEDSRQPLYLCPVCENKLAWAITHFGENVRKAPPGWWKEDSIKEWKRLRTGALLEFIDRQPSPRLGFAGFKGWLKYEQEAL